MPYVSEIRMFGGNFAPAGWMLCNGQQLPISENEVLFQLIGTAFGGDGEETFNLPDLRGRVPVHQGNGFILAATGGVETVTLTAQQIPVHTHTLTATGNLASAGAPAGQMLGLAQAATITPYGTDAPTTVMNPASLSPVGGSQPHENLQPYLTINFIISLFGQFPSQT